MSYTLDTLSQLPPPDFVEELSVDQIFRERLQELAQLDPELVSNIRIGDPIYNNQLAASKRELLLRQRINEAGKAVLPAYARGADLDQLGARYGVERQVIDPGNPDAVPPLDPILEDDQHYLSRILLSMEGQTNAGTVGAYLFHALASDPEVLDAAVDSPSAGRVLLTILSRAGDGSASEELLQRVRAYMMQPQVRQLTDELVVQTAAITSYRVDATLTAEPGPVAALAVAAARQKTQDYMESLRRLKVVVPLSGIYAALQQPGIISVQLSSPTEDIDPGDTGATFCSAIELTAVTQETPVA